MKRLKRCAAALAAGVVAIGTWGSAGAGEPYPSKPIRVIVPVAPGGGTDTTARLIGQKLNESLGQPIIVDNRPGAAGNLGVEIASKAAPDGYTLVIPITSFPASPSLYPNLPFDPVKNFAPIGLVTSAPLLLVVNPSLPAKSVKELVALAKSKPGELNYGSSGVGTTAHLGAELFNRMAGVKITGVPYKGGGPAVVDLIAGNIQLYFSTIPAAIPHTKSGRLRPIALTSLKRMPEIGDIPTVAESGLPGFEVVGWFGLFAPAGTPRPVVTKLNKEVVTILQMSDVREKLSAHGLIPGGGSPEELGAFLRAEIKKWAAVIKEAGIKLQ
jgi:tripartite-type tricarboxylate transporter receptor subunit TctC